MKKIFVTLLCVGMISVSACGNQNTEAITTEENTVIEETVQETVEEVPTETEAESVETTTEEMTIADALEVKTVTGIVTDASMNFMMIQAEDGTYYSMAESDDTMISCEDGISLGNVVDVTYTGTPEAGDTTAITISDSDKTAKADREALTFAISVIQSMQFMDLDALSTMVTYPVYVGVGDVDETIADKDAFLALDKDNLFQQDLLTSVSNYNLFDLEKIAPGYVLGEGTANITFNVDESNDYGFGITGIND